MPQLCRVSFLRLLVFHWFTLTLALTGCRNERLQQTTNSLRFTAERMEFEPVYADGQTHRATIGIVNDGQATVEVEWAMPKAPVTLVSPPRLLQSGETTLVLEFLATTAGRYSRSLEVNILGSKPVQLAIEAVAKPLPPCIPSSSCSSSSFDVAQQKCVETVLPDGQSCDPGSACIEVASCQAGRCVGTPKVCDDGNACTIDVCNATLGCENLPAPPCPGDGKCLKGVCDPSSGCGLAPAVDGTTCGTRQSCDAAEICLDGECVVRDPPDGYVCAEASPCQGRGICMADQCVRPAASMLMPTWSMDTMADPDAGMPKQLHDFVMEPSGDMTLGGFFQTPVVLRANTPEAKLAPEGVSRRCILWGRKLVCADYPANPNGSVTALDPETGHTMWTFDVRRDRPDFLMVASQIFLARLVVQTSDRMAALFEAYPNNASTHPNTQCRRYFLVTLDANGRPINGQQVRDPLLDACNHPHPYGVAADAVGNLFIAFSPTISTAAPLKPGNPTLTISFTRDGVFRWKRTDPSMAGGELAVARGLLYPENATVALLAATGVPAFSLPDALGRIVVSDARFIPAPVAGARTLAGYEAGLNTLRWTHTLPTGSTFSSDQIRLASWKVPQGKRTVALTWVQDSLNSLTPLSLRAIHVGDGSEAFSCPVFMVPRTPVQLFEVGLDRLGAMEGALDPDGKPGCGKCDPPYAGSSASFRQFQLPGIDVPFEPWIGTFGGPSHDHREEALMLGQGQN